jgi:NUMOD3 motif
MKYHYCYKVEFVEVPHIYFGARTCECLPEEDVKYMGSPVTYKRFWKENTPIKTILVTGFGTRSEANLYEKGLIYQQWEENKSLSLNASVSGETFNRVGSENSIEHRKKISRAKKGTKRPYTSPEARKNISEALKNKPKSDESRRKMSEARKKMHPKPTNAATFVGISPTGECVIFTNALQFIRDNPEWKFSRSPITKCAQGLRKRHRGWKFFYADEYKAS